MSEQSDKLDDQPDNPQDYHHNDYDPPKRRRPDGSSYGSGSVDSQPDNPQSYFHDD